MPTFCRIRQTEDEDRTGLEMARVKKELVAVKQERDPLKIYGLFRAGFAAKLGQIESMRQQLPVADMCRIFNVSARAYRVWRTRPPSVLKS